MTGRRLRALVLYAQGEQTTTLSYYYGWPRHFAADPALDARLLNLLDRGDRVRLALAPGRVDVVVLLHSVFANQPYLRGPLLERVRRMEAPKVLFVGNEYKLMPEKMAFAERLATSLLVTQLDDPRAHDLYRTRLGCDVEYVPYTGLDSDLFFPGPPLGARPIGLGYRAFDAPSYIGNDERRRLANDAARAAEAAGFVVDAALGADARLPEPAWADFLRRCRGQFGSEAGGDWFELTDDRRLAITVGLAPLADEPSHERVARLLAEPPKASGRALSGRVVEAAGTKTVQLLIEGRYGGFFRANEHYIPLRGDLSNLGEAFERLRDDEECSRIVEAAHETAATELAYPRLLDRVRSALERVL